MASLYNADLKPLTPGTYTHPYEHATKLFLADNYKLAPKQQYLYYVVIKVSDGVITDQGFLDTLGSLLTQQIFQNGLTNQTVQEQYEVGLLAKRVDLPKFKINTQVKNSYNRKNIIQTHISYDPISITFHDDAADTVLKFWNNYYTYYYRDSDYQSKSATTGSAIYQQPYKYAQMQTANWGYTPLNPAVEMPSFLESIKVYSLHNKRFTEYEYVNPFITEWRHGEHNAEQGQGIMENVMTIQYETVKYKTGYVNAIDVTGFATIHYDNVQSPISTSTTNIYDDNGLIGALSNGTKDLARSASGTDIFSSLLNIYTASKTLKNVNFSSVAKQALASYGIKAITSAVNSTLGSLITVPTAAGSTQIYQQANVLTNPVSAPNNLFGATNYGSPIGAPAYTAGVIAVGASVVNNSVNGVVTNAIQQGATKLFQVAQNNGSNILVDQYGQPVTNQSSAITLDSFGNQIATTQVLTTAAGSYNPASVNDNLQLKTTIVQEDGQVYTQYKYTDGTIVLKDPTGQDIDVQPGNNYTGQATQAAVPVNTSVLAAQGQTQAQGSLSYYTDPRTGLTYTTGGTTAQVINTVTGTAGLVAGGYAGQQLYQGLTGGFLGKSVLGQTVAAGVSSAVGLATGKLVNNALQPIANSITGAALQGFDSIKGSISNFAGEVFGTGGFTADNPTKNLVSTSSDALGNITNIYKDGTQTYQAYDSLDATVTQSSQSGNWFGNFFGSSGSSSDPIAANPNFGFGGGSIWTDGSGNPILSSDGFIGSAGSILDPFQDSSSSWFTPSETSSDWSFDFSGDIGIFGDL